MTDTSYQIAFDPGMVGSGYAVWQNQKWLKNGTIIPKGFDHLTKLIDLSQKLLVFYTDLLRAANGFVSKAIIEEWVKHIPRFKIATMLKSAEGRGVIVSVTSGYCRDICFLSKNQASKTEAQAVAKQHGVIGSKHAIDAYHLGILGGFGLG